MFNHWSLPILHLLWPREFMLITLIFYRLVFFSIRTKEILHPYWINTGAAAISTLSGTILAEKVSQTHAFIEYIPFIKGITVLIWITGTWWIPIIVVMEMRHYVLKKIPWVYDPRQWSMVFAIGMSIASWRLSLMVNSMIASMPVRAGHPSLVNAASGPYEEDPNASSPNIPMPRPGPIFSP